MCTGRSPKRSISRAARRGSSRGVCHSAQRASTSFEVVGSNVRLSAARRSADQPGPAPSLHTRPRTTHAPILLGAALFLRGPVAGRISRPSLNLLDTPEIQPRAQFHGRRELALGDQALNG